MRKKQFWLSLGLMVSVLLYALPLSAQKTTAEKTQTVDIRLPGVSKPKVVYRTFLRKSSDGVFSQLVKKIGGRSNTENLENDLESQAVNLFEAMDASFDDDLAIASAKAKEISQKKYEELQQNPPKTKEPRSKKPVRRGGPSFDDDAFFFDFEQETLQTQTGHLRPVIFPTTIFFCRRGTGN